MNSKQINFSVEEINDLLERLDSGEFTTKQYVDESILNASLNGEGTSVDLTKYALKSELNNYVSKSELTNLNTLLNALQLKITELENEIEELKNDSGGDEPEPETPHNIIYTIPTGVTLNNKPSTIQHNESFTTTITEQEGYDITSITVTMDGLDITNDVVNDI